VAKKSKIVKNERRRAIVARYAHRRAELKEIIRSPSSTGEQRGGATRVGTPAARRQRGHLRKFGLSRLRVRQLLHNGQLPGVRKASW
jgi:small subunit ribosomal protein S14